MFENGSECVCGGEICSWWTEINYYKFLHMGLRGSSIFDRGNKCFVIDILYQIDLILPMSPLLY